MLVITRRKDESIIIGNNIKITFLKNKNNKLCFGIDAPRSIPVNRKENNTTQKFFDQPFDSDK